MRISDEECRSFANSLRYISQNPPEWATSACAIAEVFDADYPLWADSGELFAILADLIDRPKAQRDDAGDYWRCGHCGEFTRKNALADCVGFVAVRRCGNCGREWE